MSLYRDTAIVLRTHKLGEADRIVVLMTRGAARCGRWPRGYDARHRSSGRGSSRASHIQVQLHEGRGDLDIVTQAETVEAYRRTREDLSRLARAASLLEAVEQLGPGPRAVAPPVRHARRVACGVIEERNPPMVSAAFYLKLLALEGLAPELDVCVECGEEGGPFVLGARGRWRALRQLRRRARGVGRGPGGEPGGAERWAERRAGPARGRASPTRWRRWPPTALEAHVERRLRSLRVLHDG